MNRFRILHLEDDMPYRAFLRGALSGINNIELVEAESLEDFRTVVNRPPYDFHLGIFDRNFPEKSNGKLDDSSWRVAVSLFNCLYPESPVLILSGNPPAAGDWMKYTNIREVLNKSAISIEDLRSKVESYVLQEKSR